MSRRLGNDPTRTAAAVVGGSLVPAAILLLWSASIFASPDIAASASGAIEAGLRFDPLAATMSRGGLGGAAVEVFSGGAVATTVLGFVLGLVDFFADVLSLDATDRATKRGLVALALAPPLAVSLFESADIFFSLVDFSGAVVATLFGVLPAAMAFKARRGGGGVQSVDGGRSLDRLVPGGDIALAAIAALSLGIVGIEAASAMGNSIGGAG